MPRTIQLAELRKRAKERANMEKSNFLTDDEWNYNINASADWLYDMLVEAYGEDYYTTTVDFSTVANQDYYAFSSVGLSTFYKLRGVGIVTGSAEEIPMRKFSLRDRGASAGIYSWNRYGRTNLRYRLRGDGLFLNRQPDGGQTLRIYYIPARTKMVNDGSTLDGVNGWEELVIVDAAIKAMNKEESDSSKLENERMILVDRIKNVSENRDAAEPESTSDVTKHVDYDFYGVGGFEI